MRESGVSDMAVDLSFLECGFCKAIPPDLVCLSTTVIIILYGREGLILSTGAFGSGREGAGCHLLMTANSRNVFHIRGITNRKGKMC